MKDAKGHGSNASNGAGSPRSGLRSQDRAPTDAEKRGSAAKAAAGAQPVAFFDRPAGYPAAHQSGVADATNPTLAEGRELYKSLAAVAFARHGGDHSGWSKGDLFGFSGGTNQGGHYK